MQLCRAPSPAPVRNGPERIAAERLDLADYLDLYRRVGAPLRWDQRLQMDPDVLASLLRSGLVVYLLWGGSGEALGLCEFDLTGFPDVELKNFGLVPQAQGRGLGPWLLGVALESEWRRKPRRIWLHTDTWDHPAAMAVYRRAGFEITAVTRESPEHL